MLVFSQGINGCVPALFHGRDRRSELIMRGAVTSEKEALLLGEYHCYQRDTGRGCKR